MPSGHFLHAATDVLAVDHVYGMSAGHGVHWWAPTVSCVHREGNGFVFTIDFQT